MKVGVIDAFIHPIIAYGCETWAPKKADYEALDVWWMKTTRRILGVTIMDKVKNVEILKRLKNKFLSQIWGKTSYNFRKLL